MQRFSPGSRTRWMLAAAAWVVVGALTTVRTGSPLLLIGPPLIMLGLIHLAHGLYRFRYPRWRERAWWKQHQLLGKSLAGPQDYSGPFAETFAAALQTALGIAFVFGGVLSVWSGVAAVFE